MTVKEHPYTGKQFTLIQVLGDGKTHTAKELMQSAKIPTMATLAVFLGRLRSKIKAINGNLDIIIDKQSSETAYRFVKSEPAYHVDAML